MLKRIFWELCPPVIYRALASAKARIGGKRPALFDGDDALFKKIVPEAKVYAEYGCGFSTMWVASNTQCRILGVDSTKHWLDKVRQGCARTDLVTLHHADVGTTGDWGRPVNYDKRDNFSDYTDWVWKQDAAPDVVLIDGRFRICCFLTSLLFAREGTRILFDDYTDREHYHFIELFLKPVQTCGRQVLFVVPAKSALDEQKIKTAIQQFRFVMD